MAVIVCKVDSVEYLLIGNKYFIVAEYSFVLINRSIKTCLLILNCSIRGFPLALPRKFFIMKLFPAGARSWIGSSAATKGIICVLFMTASPGDTTNSLFLKEMTPPSGITPASSMRRSIILSTTDLYPLDIEATSSGPNA